jgi:sulfur carrier protein
MQILLNGLSEEFEPGITVRTLLDRAGFTERRVAVEVNREIVPKSEHAVRVLRDGDLVEIVHALGGG